MLFCEKKEAEQEVVFVYVCNVVVVGRRGLVKTWMYCRVRKVLQSEKYCIYCRVSKTVFGVQRRRRLHFFFFWDQIAGLNRFQLAPVMHRVLAIGGGRVGDGQREERKAWAREAEETIISVLNQNRIKSPGMAIRLLLHTCILKEFHGLEDENFYQHNGWRIFGFLYFASKSYPSFLLVCLSS